MRLVVHYAALINIIDSYFMRNIIIVLLFVKDSDDDSLRNITLGSSSLRKISVSLKIIVEVLMIQDPPKATCLLFGHTHCM